MANSTNVPQIPFPGDFDGMFDDDTVEIPLIGDMDGIFFGSDDDAAAGEFFFGGLDFVTPPPTEEFDEAAFEMRMVVISLVVLLVASIFPILKFYHKYKNETENDQQVETSATNIQIPDGSAVERPTGKTIKHQTTGNTATTGNQSTSNNVGTSGNFPKSYAQTYDDAPKKTSRFLSPVKR